jgi:hypothetical protein
MCLNVLNFKHEVRGRTYNMFCLSYVSFPIVGCELIIRLFNDVFICVFFSKERSLTVQFVSSNLRVWNCCCDLTV